MARELRDNQQGQRSPFVSQHPQLHLYSTALTSIYQQVGEYPLPSLFMSLKSWVINTLRFWGWSQEQDSFLKERFLSQLRRKIKQDKFLTMLSAWSEVLQQNLLKKNDFIKLVGTFCRVSMRLFPYRCSDTDYFLTCHVLFLKSLASFAIGSWDLTIRRHPWPENKEMNYLCDASSF